MTARLSSTINSASGRHRSDVKERPRVSAIINYNQFADKYMASWNEEDPEIRHKLIEELWAEDATYYNRIFVCHGPAQMEYAVGRSHDEYYEKGFTFKSQNDAYGHHNGVRFGWVMISADTGEVDTFGQDFIVLNDDGQIVIDYQFMMKRPSV
jgi:hypothetical protein